MIDLLNRRQIEVENFIQSHRWINITIVALLLLGMILGGCIPQAHDRKPELASTSSSLKPGRVLGVVVDETMLVLEVEPKSAAEVAGIQKGDVLQSIDNAAFLEARDNIKEMIGHYSDEDKPMQLTLRRDGKALVVEVRPLPMQIQFVDMTPTPVFLPNYYF